MDIYWRTISRKNASDLKLSVTFNNNNIDVLLFDCTHCWKANISESNLRVHAERYRTELSTYLNDIKKYLIQPLDNVEITLFENTFRIKIILDNQMKTIYFETIMIKVDFATNILSTVDNLFAVKKQCFDDFNNLKTENEKLKEAKFQLEAKLNEFIERKKTDEEEIFSKFVVLLNEKKRQIQHLNDLLIAFKHGRTINNPNIVTHKESKKIEDTPKAENISNNSDISSDESNSDQSYNTEDEEQVSFSQQKALKLSKETFVETHHKRELMELTDDIPTVHLTKRLRQKSVDLSSTLQSQSIKGENIEKDSISTQNDVGEELPSVTSNTQDLLDNI
ncbi:uncharacterized protein LOC143195661 isoform X1 [Rhynchophorus ferrugineus]|uniref:uncharacterized protein LOC143195661 isoform X1 n=1 Tax=Rhynchophorus ferrugineus TaxID=354439 RepID=UPI003FCC9381